MPPNTYDQRDPVLAVAEEDASWSPTEVSSEILDQEKTKLLNMRIAEDPGLARLKETIGNVPSRGYVQISTPVEEMPRLTKLCDGPKLYVKRDDLLPLAGGGSKTRKLGTFERASGASRALIHVLFCFLVELDLRSKQSANF